MERLNKYLARCGVASRRKADELINQGHVLVNDKLVKELGFKIDTAKDKVEVDGKVIKPPEKFLYYILNKPLGIITASSDKRYETVLDIVKIKQRVFPVGRLDKNSRGLVLLTNNGDLAYKLLQPKFEYPKKYVVLLDGLLDERGRQKLLSGIPMPEGKAVFAALKILKTTQKKQSVEITLKQGMKRQIRRMLKKTGFNVLDLKRISIGPLKLGNLPEGKYRSLTPKEIKELRATVL